MKIVKLKVLLFKFPYLSNGNIYLDEEAVFNIYR